MSTPLEKALERKVVGFCKSKGLLCYKFTSPSNRGVPDRVVIGPKGVLFLELKREGCKPTPLQSYHIERIREAGGNAAWADNLDTAEALIERYCAGADIPSSVGVTSGEAKVRLTKSEGMGIFMHITKRDGNGAGMLLDGTVLEAWANEILESHNSNSAGASGSESPSAGC